MMQALAKSSERTAKVHPSRAVRIHEALDRAVDAGGINVLLGSGVNDLIVDEGKLRETAPTCSAWAAQRGMATWIYSTLEGLRPLETPGGPTNRVPSSVTGRAPASDLARVRDELFRSANPGMLIIDRAEAIFPSGAGPGFDDAEHARLVELITTIAVDPKWRAAGHRVVLIARTETVDERVLRAPGFEVTDLGLPDHSERIDAVELMQSSRSHVLSLDASIDADTAAHLAGGLYLHGLSRIRNLTNEDSPLSKSRIVDLKRAELDRVAGDVLTIHHETVTMEADVAGMPQVRRVLQEELLTASRACHIALYGPPGGGKSWVAVALAASLGVVAVSPKNIKDRWVGSSERNQRRMLDAIRSLAPVLFILDEAESSGLGSRSHGNDGDGNDVNGALRAMLFEFLGDVGEQSGIHVVAMSNFPSKLDAAARDRLTGIPILHPTSRELAQIMKIQARRAGIQFDETDAAEVLDESRQTISARHAVRLLHRAQIFARTEGRLDVRGTDVELAIADSMYQVGTTEELQCLLAIDATSYASHLPWNAAHYLDGEPIRPPDYVEQFVYPDGSVDRPGLTARIRELEVTARGY